MHQGVGIMAELDDVIRSSPIAVSRERYAVVRLAEPCPLDDHFLVCRDADETTLIAPEARVPWAAALATETWFRLLAIHMATPFATPGFLARVTSVLAQRGINVYVVSTFSKDYVLLKEEDLERGVAALAVIGFPIVGFPAEGSGPRT